MKRRNLGKSVRIKRIVMVMLLKLIAAAITTGCNSTPTAPGGSEAFAVQNIAVYDGEWKDPQMGVSSGSYEPGVGTSVVNCIKQSPHNHNTLVVAGDYSLIRSASYSGQSAGLSLVYLYGGYRALAQGEDDALFYQGGPYTAVEFHPVDDKRYLAGSNGEVSNLEEGLLHALGMFDDGSRQWQSLDEEYFSGDVLAMERVGNDIYIGGNFDQPFGNRELTNLIRYDATDGSLHSMNTEHGRGGEGIIDAIESVDGGLIVGGSFTTIGGVAANNIARWNGSGWEAIGDGLNGYVRDILWHDGAIYAAGRFYTNDDHFGICARFDGTSWTVLGEASDDEVYNQGHALASYRGRVILGGHFKTINGRTVNNIAQWDDERSQWIEMYEGGVDLSSTPETELQPEVNAFAVVGNQLYVGGRFDRLRVR